MSKEMKAVVTVKAEKLEIQTREVPEISENQLLLKFKYVGICGSDIHIFYGKHPFVGPEFFPLVQGHEGVATVAKVGSAVTDFKEGDYVTVMPQIFCGKCEMCRTGNPHICETLLVLGCQADGYLAEYFAVDADLALKLDPSDDMLAMSLIEPLAVAVGGVRKLGALAGKKVLVFGAGVIGNLSAQVAKANGALEVTIADISEYRLKLATETCGIDKNIYIPGVKPEEEVEVYSGYDCILECVGIESTLRTSIKYSKKNSKMVILGVFGKEVTLPMALVQDKELKIEGHLMYEEIDFNAAIGYIRASKVNVKSLVFDKVAFKDSENVYNFIAENKEKALKVIIDMEEK